MIFQEFMNYLQISPGSIYFFLVFVTWSIYLTSDKSLFLHKALSTKSTPHSPKLFHQEDATEKRQFSNSSGSIY